jgi:hypothetical protein
MVYKLVTLAQTKEFWDKMCKHYGTSWKYKKDAWEAKAIGKALDAANIVKYSKWMNSYATILGRTIYLPFKPGQESDKYTTVRQVSLCVHEHQHYHDACERGKVLWSWEYLRSSKKRAIAEASGYKTNIEMYLWFYGKIRNPEFIIDILTSAYKCDMKDALLAEGMLDRYVMRLERGVEYESAVTRKAIEFLEEMLERG